MYFCFSQKDINLRLLPIECNNSQTSFYCYQLQTSTSFSLLSRTQTLYKHESDKMRPFSFMLGLFLSGATMAAPVNEGAASPLANETPAERFFCAASCLEGVRHCADSKNLADVEEKCGKIPLPGYGPHDPWDIFGSKLKQFNSCATGVYTVSGSTNINENYYAIAELTRIHLIG